MLQKLLYILWIILLCFIYEGCNNKPYIPPSEIRWCNAYCDALNSSKSIILNRVCICTVSEHCIVERTRDGSFSGRLKHIGECYGK